MSLIFDRFPSRKKAENFAAFIEGKYGLKGQIFEDETAAMVHEPFPYKLDPSIVHIDRPGDDHLEVEDILKIEEAVEAEVRAFGGTFAGT
jgi:hypothetical protein